MSESIIQFDALIVELLAIYERCPLVGVGEVKPRLVELCNIIESDLSHRDEYRSRLLGIVNQIGEDMPVWRYLAEVHILDFCMRHFKWEDIGIALKERYNSIADANVRLEVEGLIKAIFDPEWKEGKYKKVTDLNIWDWA